MKHSTSESYSITRCASKTVKPILTNEEWLCQLSTEEKAGFISAVLDYGFGIDYKPINPMGENVHTMEDIERWLKEKHNESV